MYEYIKSVTFPNNKTRAIIKAARMIEEDFGGELPSDIDNLIKLPGVGRKTANVMLAVVWNKAAMAVDTHVFRVSNRLGLTDNSKTPLGDGAHAAAAHPRGAGIDSPPLADSTRPLHLQSPAP